MKDKTVVITGATSGLGRATALQLGPHPQRVTNKSTVRSVRRFLLETGVKL
jgi:NAD(P)-dependent dehydrogenase (short-subunit alcohol dehydrogenase family)